MNITKRIRFWLGWCPIVSGKEKRAGQVPVTDFVGGFRISLASLHLIIGIGFLVNVLYVLKNMPWFPGWIMDIDIVASTLLFIIALVSIFIAFDVVRSEDAHKILSLVNLALISVLFVYLSWWTVEKTSRSILGSLRSDYMFTLQSLIIFTLIIAIPSLVNLLRDGTYEVRKKTGIILLITLILIPATFASLYYYINWQKSNLLIEKGEDYEIYPAVSYWWGQSAVVFVDSDKWSSGSAVGLDEYDALKFLEGLDDGKVMAWWDFGLRIKALAKKEPVIYFASKEIKPTIGRVGFNAQFEPANKVSDVATFFTTNNEDEAKALMEKYGAVYIYFPKKIEVYLFDAMRSASGQDGEYENSMYYRFENGVQMEYFEKIYENEYAAIYRLKRYGSLTDYETGVNG